MNKVREALENIVAMIDNCSGVPTQPDSLVQMIKAGASAALASLPAPLSEGAVDVVKDCLAKFHRNSCYPEAGSIELDIAARAIIARLGQQGWQPPAGWKLVPEKATDEMVKAMVLQMSQTGQFLHVYDAALSAAPKP